MCLLRGMIQGRPPAAVQQALVGERGSVSVAWRINRSLTPRKNLKGTLQTMTVAHLCFWRVLWYNNRKKRCPVCVMAVETQMGFHLFFCGSYLNISTKIKHVYSVQIPNSWDWGFWDALIDWRACLGQVYFFCFPVSSPGFLSGCKLLYGNFHACLFQHFCCWPSLLAVGRQRLEML